MGANDRRAVLSRSCLAPTTHSGTPVTTDGEQSRANAPENRAFQGGAEIIIAGLGIALDGDHLRNDSNQKAAAGHD